MHTKTLLVTRCLSFRASTHCFHGKSVLRAPNVPSFVAHRANAKASFRVCSLVHSRNLKNKQVNPSPVQCIAELLGLDHDLDYRVAQLTICLLRLAKSLQDRREYDPDLELELESLLFFRDQIQIAREPEHRSDSKKVTLYSRSSWKDRNAHLCGGKTLDTQAVLFFTRVTSSQEFMACPGLISLLRLIIDRHLPTR